MSHVHHFKSKVLFSSSAYTVCFTRAGIIVQSTKTGKGAIMSQAHTQYNDWVVSWDNLMDTAEGNDLCRAFLRA